MVRLSEMLSPAGSFLLHRRGLASAQHDVEAITQSMEWHSRLPVQNRNEALAGRLVRCAVKNRVEGQQRIAWKKHLRDQSGCKGRTKYREMNMCRTPGVVMVAPWIHSRSNCDKPVATIG